LAVARWQWS